MARRAFEIVIICTGNQFRSPIVEGLMKVAVSNLPVRISSFGIEKLGPARALPEAIRHASRFGVNLKNHRAKALAGENISNADLVIGFELVHVAVAVVDAGAAYERTFTILELVALLDLIDSELPDDPIERARAAIVEAHRLRGRSGEYYPEHQVKDPIGGTAELFESTAEQLRATTAKLVDLLFGISSHSFP
jgi:protein-tyrosine phosphatase